MKSARNQFILLGLICQGFSWDGYGLALFNIALWVMALWIGRHRWKMAPAIEPIGILLGGVAGFFASRAMGQSAHFAFGHAITALQFMRMLRPLNRREEVFALVAACMQIGVACTVVFDYRFIVIFIGIATLLPRAFMELERAQFKSENDAATPTPVGPLKLGWRSLGLIIVGAIAFFIVFPRGFLGTPLQFRRGGAQSTLSDSMLDPANSGLAQSRQVVLQINGERIGYLRSFALAKLDGERWMNDGHESWNAIPFVNPNDLGRYPARQVRVKNATVLGRILPADGHVVFLRGNFFSSAYLNDQDAIACTAIWNQSKNLYDYWTDPSPRPVNLGRRELRDFTQYPPQSERVQGWLAEHIKDAPDTYAAARKLEAFLRDNFTYELGAPELNRHKPTEDFLLNEKRGHCERFAATLALLLRMQGVPSRVVLGYVPSSRDWFSGWWNVRFADAHAWTEGWFPGRGWVQFDATPRGTLPPEAWSMRQLLEDLDFAWYAHVVNFDAPSQSELLQRLGQGLGEVSLWVRANEWVLALPLAVIAILMAIRKQAWRWLAFRTARQEPVGAFAAHQYGQMLQLLARNGWHRPLHQTPQEFLASLRSNQPPWLEDVTTITTLFCHARYGMIQLSDAQAADLKAALHRIEQSFHPKPS